MCGIGGFLSSETLESSRLDVMMHALRHRGPDGQGQRLWRGQSALKPANSGAVHAALGHRRLAIVDLSEDGAEPMPNEDATLWLTFNGEIYNHELLRSPLLALGHRFRGRCDAEVLLHGYEQEGVDFFCGCRGCTRLRFSTSHVPRCCCAETHTASSRCISHATKPAWHLPARCVHSCKPVLGEAFLRRHWRFSWGLVTCQIPWP